MLPLIKTVSIIIASVAIISMGVLTACSNSYQPAKNATAKRIYDEACAECHVGTPEAPRKYWVINSKNANKTYISYKVRAGGLIMHRFPNINKDDLDKLSVFVLQNSLIK